MVHLEDRSASSTALTNSSPTSSPLSTVPRRRKFSIGRPFRSWRRTSATSALSPRFATAATILRAFTSSWGGRARTCASRPASNTARPCRRHCARSHRPPPTVRPDFVENPENRPAGRPPPLSPPCRSSTGCGPFSPTRPLLATPSRSCGWEAPLPPSSIFHPQARGRPPSPGRAAPRRSSPRTEPQPGRAAPVSRPRTANPGGPRAAREGLKLAVGQVDDDGPLRRTGAARATAKRRRPRPPAWR